MHDLFKSIVDGYHSLPAVVAAATKASEVNVSNQKTLKPAPVAGKPLAQREREIAEALATGERPRVIAKRLGLSVKTVATYRKRILEKLGMHSNAELAVWFDRQQQPDYRQALTDLVALVEHIHDATEGNWPPVDINCAVCTQGCAPASGVCSWHAAKRMLAVKS